MLLDVTLNAVAVLTGQLAGEKVGEFLELGGVSMAALKRATKRSERQCRNYRNGTVRPPAALLGALWALMDQVKPRPPKARQVGPELSGA